MAQIGGDSPNTMPTAIQAGLQARQIAKLSIDPAAKFTMDGFKQSFNPGKLLSATQSNLPIAEAMQQQSMMTRWAAKIPFVRNWLGPDYLVNETIGKLGKEALNGVSKTAVTKAVLEGGNDAAQIAKNLKALNLGDDAIKQVTASVEQRIAAAGAGAATEIAATTTSTVVKAGAQSFLTHTGQDLSKSLVGLTMKSGVVASEKVVGEALKAAAANPANARKILMDAGFYAKNLNSLGMTTEAAAMKLGEATAKAAASTEATAVTQAATKTGAKGWFGKIFGGAKGNFIVAGIFSLASNAIQLAQGKMSVKQFVALTVMDTGAYGLIGMGSAAAGGAIGAAVGTLIPIPFVGTALGFLAGLGIGFLGGMIYEKVLRNPVKDMLGGTPAGGTDQNQYDPGAYNQPGPAGANNGYAPLPPAPSAQMDYDQAMREIERLAASR